MGCYNKVEKALDPSRALSWKTKLNHEQCIQAECLVGDRLKTYGYASDYDLSIYACVFPRLTFSKSIQCVPWAAGHNMRLWPASRSERPANYIYVESPGAAGWFKGGRLMRCILTLKHIAILCYATLRARPVYWMRHQKRTQHVGICAGFLTRCLRRTAHTIQPTDLG